jgi:hypothetical protein
MSNIALRKSWMGSVQRADSGRLQPWMFYGPVEISVDCQKSDWSQEASN